MGAPMTYGTQPSQTSTVLSKPLIVLNPPPLPPYRYPYGRPPPYISCASTREYFAAAALAGHIVSGRLSYMFFAPRFDSTRYPPLAIAKPTVVFSLVISWIAAICCCAPFSLPDTAASGWKNRP